METRDGSFPIREGSVILLRPNLWHRYRPLKGKGWKEHYVGFMGATAERMIKSSEILNNSPVVQIGFDENIINNFREIFNHIKTEKPGYHQVCAGLVIFTLGQIISIKKNENFKHSLVEKAIQKAIELVDASPSGK